MPAAALSSAEHAGSPLRVVARHLDFVLLGTALPIFIVAGWPLAGYAVAAGVWTAQALLVAKLEASAAASDNPRTIVALLVGGSIARAWVAAIAILACGLAFGDAAGLACALMLIALFTVYFANKMVVHYLESQGAE